ncbi:SsgA family sporulation/cell division regulator [Nonomuraea typhae]|uniref:SsgA family sporulation/cell division regulator n=1 Tax=Nonomuraea typhae TaxID=2603600 RepID=UPI0012F8299C|nr:SsgA family sporulation/cell division regulator [Nonomuraea typhae]
MKTITRGLVLWTEDQQRLRAIIAYQPTDPYAVRLAFVEGGPNRETVVYRFARDLLAEGLDQAAGECDVLVAPHVVPGWQVITLRPGPDARMTVYTETGPVEEFVTDIYRLIPMGRERELVDVDQALATILRGVAL